MSAATSLIQDLAPYAAMTVADGITVGDLTFSSAQTFYSTGAIACTVNNQLDANSNVTLFSGAVNDAGAQGFSATSTLTESETNLFDANGRLGSNECFVGVRCGFDVYRRTGNNLAATESIRHIGSVDALHALLTSLSWNWNPGDTLSRTIGSLGDYPAGGGVYSGVAIGGNAAGVATGGNSSFAANNGVPSCYTQKKLPLPIVWKPNIRTQVKVSCGTGATLTTALLSGQNAIAAGEYFIIRMSVQGVLFTMPV
jgi:hypothetical protein